MQTHTNCRLTAAQRWYLMPREQKLTPTTPLKRRSFVKASAFQSTFLHSPFHLLHSGTAERLGETRLQDVRLSVTKTLWPLNHTVFQLHVNRLNILKALTLLC